MANQVIEDTDKEAFGVSDVESEADSMPDLISVSDLSDQEDVGSEDRDEPHDWFSYVGDGFV